MKPTTLQTVLTSAIAIAFGCAYPSHASLLLYEGFQTGAGDYTADTALYGQTYRGLGEASVTWGAASGNTGSAIVRAIGLKRAGVVRLFTTESMLLTLLGCTLGFAITLAVRWGINLANVSYTPPNSASPVPLLISLDVARVSFTFVLMGVVGTIAAYLPARRAAKKQIIDALGHV